MLILFGSRTKNKVLGQEILRCRYCDQDAMHTFIESQSWFTLYFIPVFPGMKVRVAQCDLCGAISHGSQEDLVIDPGDPSTTQCPECNAWVKVGAFVCGTCGHTFTPEEMKRATENAKAKQTSDVDEIWKRLQR